MNLGRKITIATPCLNAVSTIEKTIQSVINAKQKCDYTIEYIIIDGASTDGTIDIIEKYRSNVDYFVSEKDAGLYDAFNKCVKQATGDYILILAADDFLLNGAIDAFGRSIKEETEIWVGSIVFWGEGYYQYMFSDKDLTKLRFCCSLRHPATFFKKTVFEKYGYYNSEYKIAGDHELFLRLYRKGATFQIEDIPVAFFSTDGISNQNIEDTAVLEEKKIMKEYGLSDEEIRSFYEHSCNKKMINILRTIALKTHTYRFICKLLHREKKFISKNRLKDLGFFEMLLCQ